MSVTNRIGDTNEATIFQWFVSCPSLANILNWPITVDTLASTGIHLHMICKDTNADAEEVAKAWREFAASLGPTVTSNVFHDEHWRKLVPFVDVPSEDYRAVVWQGETQDVVAEVVFDDEGKPYNLAFAIEVKQ